MALRTLHGEKVEEKPTEPSTEVRAREVREGHVRKFPVRPRTVSKRALKSRGYRVHLPMLIAEDNCNDLYVRPATRSDCMSGGINEERPCPFVSCQFHLATEVNAKNGNLKLVFPGLPIEKMEETCVLDIADKGENTLEEVAKHINCTRERVRQIANVAIGRLHKNGSAKRLAEECYADVGPQDEEETRDLVAVKYVGEFGEEELVARSEVEPAPAPVIDDVVHMNPAPALVEVPASAPTEERPMRKRGALQSSILTFIREAPRTTREIADHAGISTPNARMTLGRLAKIDRVQRDEAGRWTPGPNIDAPAASQVEVSAKRKSKKKSRSKPRGKVKVAAAPKTKKSMLAGIVIDLQTARENILRRALKRSGLADEYERINRAIEDLAAKEG